MGRRREPWAGGANRGATRQPASWSASTTGPGAGAWPSAAWPPQWSCRPRGQAVGILALLCGYLAELYCLGVKKIIGPEITDEAGLRRFLPEYYAAYPYGWQEAPIELARHIVFGAIDYACGLGFERTVPDLVDAVHRGRSSTGSWSGWEALAGSSPPSTSPRRYST